MPKEKSSSSCEANPKKRCLPQYIRAEADTFELCSRVGDQDHAVADDMRQWESIQRLGSFSDEEMETFMREATEIVRAQEGVIRKVALELDRRRRLTGEQVTRIIETHGA